MRVALLGIALVALGCQDDVACDAVITFEGATPDICAAVANDEASRVLGLSDHEALAPDAGLLLDFPAEGEVCITNAAVSFEIDAFYLTEAGKVTAIERFSAGQPGSVCHLMTRYVLETMAGSHPDVAVGDDASITLKSP